MLNRSSKNKKPHNLNKLAHSIVNEATVESSDGHNIDNGKNPAAVALGKLGGLKGGPARARKLTKEHRSEIARNAAKVRWQKEKEEI